MKSEVQVQVQQRWLTGSRRRWCEMDLQERERCSAGDRLEMNPVGKDRLAGWYGVRLFVGGTGVQLQVPSSGWWPAADHDTWPNQRLD